LGRFCTRVLTEGVTPSLHVSYKHAAHVDWLNQAGFENNAEVDWKSSALPTTTLERGPPTSGADSTIAVGLVDNNPLLA